MPKYNFYNVVYRVIYSEEIEDRVCIAKSKQSLNRSLLNDVGVSEVLKIDKLLIQELYKEEFKKVIEQFIDCSKLRKFKIILFNPETDDTAIITVLAESKREIYAKYRIYKVFYISTYTPSFDEYCKYYFE